MSTLKSFSCPTCAAPVSITSASIEVRCDFCGNMVVVPPEFRPKQVEPTPPPQSNFSRQTDYSGGMPAIYRPRPMSFWSIAPAILIVGAVIVGISYYFVAQSALESRASRPPATQIVVAAQITRAPNTAESPRASPMLSATPTLSPTVPPGVLAVTAMALANQATNAVQGTTTAAALTSSAALATIVSEFGSVGVGLGHFQDLRCIAVDSTGNIYTGEYGGRIQKFDATGSYITSWIASGQTALTAMVADRKGNLYVVRQATILKYDGTGKLLKTFSGYGYGDIKILPDGNLLATSSYSGDDLVKVNASTGAEMQRFNAVISSQSGHIEGSMIVAVDGLGAMYAIGVVSESVFVFNASGKFQNRFGAFRGTALSVSVDAQRQLYVADFAGLHIFNAAGLLLGDIALPNRKAFQTVITDQGDMFVAADDRVYKLHLNAVTVLN